jgi:hypothetical protein
MIALVGTLLAYVSEPRSGSMAVASAGALGFVGGTCVLILVGVIRRFVVVAAVAVVLAIVGFMPSLMFLQFGSIAVLLSGVRWVPSGRDDALP